MMANLHKEVWKPNLRCDGSEVHTIQFVSKTFQLFFIFRAQDRDGGQSDVCFIKVILDLLCILCVTIREGGGRENIAANEVWVNEDKQFQHMFNGHEDMLGLNGRTLTLDTFSSSSRSTISCRWNVVHRGWFSLQSLQTVISSQAQEVMLSESSITEQEIHSIKYSQYEQKKNLHLPLCVTYL